MIIRIQIVLLSITFLITSIQCVAAGEYPVHQLTAENFLSLTEGKNIFIKFYAPWCSRCRAMEDDWNRLATDFQNHEHTIIGQVDCTSDAGKIICEEYEIQNYPTLMYGNPWSADTYAGDRDYESLSAFAQENLSKPICSVSHPENCSEEDKKVIESLKELSKDDLEDLMFTVEEQVKAAEDDFDEQVVKIQRAYDALVQDFNTKLDSIKDAYNYKYMEQVLMSHMEDEEEL